MLIDSQPLKAATKIQMETALTSQRIQQHLLQLTALVTFVVGAYFLLTSLYLWQHLHVHIPIKDSLHQLPLVQAVLEHGFWSTTPGDWLAPFAGAHRITMTRLLMALDYRYFSGQNHLIYASAWLSIVTIVLVYVSTFRKSYRSARSLLLFVVGLTLIFVLSHTQIWNLINPINNSWYVALAASALGIYLIANNPAAPTPACFVAAYLLASVAALSNFAGVLAWLLLPLLILLKSVQGAAIAVLVSAVFLTLYLHEIAPDTAGLLQNSDFMDRVKDAGAEPLPVLQHWLQRGAHVFTKTCLYLGSPLSIDHPRLASATVVSSLLTVAAGWLQLVALRFSGQRRHNAWLELTLTMATLCLGVAIATQMGRVLFSSPTADRYQTVVMVYWLSVCGLVLFFGLQTGVDKRLAPFVAALLCLGVSAVLLVNAAGTIPRSARVAEAANRTTVLGQLDVIDLTLHRSLLAINKRDYFTEFNDFFNRHRVAYKAHAVQAKGFETAEDCGFVSLNARLSIWPDIYVVTGSIDDHWAIRQRQILLSTLQGDLIGHLFPAYGHEATIATLLTGKNSHWRGYFKKPGIATDTIYMRYRSTPFATRSCRIAM